ncbi:AraC family transcriptional regulator [Enterovibrio norvegicus]|uniref:Helix-turn-helix transcriptional regulator n=1 Tax=Enterovibrio norvegicus TaxID=188144 RepID=A0ABV4L2L2_9GAMM|nr:AraC family transcriptional regulator [Enterovibrio norvegicus]MCC4796633.1 AraC family transcriptional regulator [Enterovibrio norvegicus]OEF55447.1 AraC family transcriptional regulator [Enterovibrio norvegicus]PMH65795.1 AraC family transcriptional regulator [Enterovibrio norvegicus]PMI35852.1 AraC family transcriptional regulator [Enterovibrio norvegicus]PMN56784.1 AraC family transcriptional regulator [Enterovibrio norvegicus]
MSQVFSLLLDNLLGEREHFNRIWFASDQVTPPTFSYQVNFPRLELVISGEYPNQIENADKSISEVTLFAGDALYVPPNSWNKPNWETDCSVLSLLFGKRQLGLSLVGKAKAQPNFYDVQKHSIQTRTGHAIDHILSALNSLGKEPVQSPMDSHLLHALLSYSQQMLLAPEAGRRNRVEDLYQGICIYIQENFHRDISRESIASRFSITPNHLSRLFRQQGHMRMADYITWVRVDRAKFMLKRYDFRLSEVATRCGFQDVNYFYRVFKAKTGLTPSEYRGSNYAQSS